MGEEYQWMPTQVERWYEKLNVECEEFESDKHNEEIEDLMEKLMELEDYENTKRTIKKIMADDYRGFVKALISIELSNDNDKILNELYEKYIDLDDCCLINENFYEWEQEMEWER